MLPPFTRSEALFLWTNFLCSFTWWGSCACQILPSFTSGLISVGNYKNVSKIGENASFSSCYSPQISNLTPNSNFSANFDVGNTLLSQHLLPGGQSRVCLRFRQECPQIGHFLLPLRTKPGLLSTCVQNTAKFGLGWFLWMYRKVLNHLSQK